MSDSKIPFTLSFASKPEVSLAEPSGAYDEATQTWIGLDDAMKTTWCRSSTTGIITMDPDEDEDDDR